MRSLVLFVAVAVPAFTAAAGETWSELRGPSGNGRAEATGLPLTWSETENIAWKTPIHDRGWSSPVIWHDQIWVTTATPDGHRMYAVCVDRATGRIVHDVPVFETEALDPIAEVNSYASPTPAIEAGRVYVHFGTYGTACLDTQTGRIVWTRRDLKCDHHEGPGSSPILFENLLIVHVDGRDTQYVVALEKTTGQTAWKTARSVDYGQVHFNTRKAFCTPTVVEAGGRLQLVSPAAKAVFGYDPRTGRELWKVRYNGWSMVARPLFGQGLLFVSTDYERPEFWAIRPDGQGDVTDTHVAWTIKRGMPSKPSSLLIGDLLYIGNDEGIVHCVEARTGELVWKERVRGTYSASPLVADSRIYFFNQDAVTTVIEPGRQFKLLAVNELSREQLMASPAVAGKALFLRTRTHLYRIEQRSP